MEEIETRWPRAIRAAEIKHIGSDIMIVAIYQHIFLSEGITPAFSKEMDTLEEWICSPRYKYLRIGAVSFVDCISTWSAVDCQWPPDMARLFAAAGVELPDNDKKDGEY